MDKTYLKFSFLIFLVFFIIKNIQPVETGHSFDFRTGAEINTSLGSRFITEGKYELILDRHFQLSPGFLLAPGWSFLSTYHLETGYYQLFTESLSIHLKFLNRSYHISKIAENSIIPYLSWRSENFEADLGVNLRFTNFGPENLNLVFYYPRDLIQPLLAFRIAGYLVWKEPDIRLGMEIKNIDWNNAANSFNFSFHIDGVYQITKNWGLKLNMGTSPSGINGLSLDFNRLLFLAGAQYKI